MSLRDAHHIWTEQCESAQTIKARFGLTAAVEYLVGEKLINFAETASTHPDFAQELPQFVSEVRRMFTRDEIKQCLAQIERAQKEEEEANGLEEDDPFPESSEAVAERSRRFTLLKDLLTATTLGTS